MTYEEFLDEVTTLIYEKYALSEEAAVKLVVKAQSDSYFLEHDKNDAMRTEDRAHKDAKILYERSLKK